jgi:hypothetical protein
MAIQNRINTTLNEFRQEISTRGLQIASLYEVTLSHTASGQPLVCYPMSVVVPGREFVYYNHDVWGPTRKIPYKRQYTQSTMSFIIHDDWAERLYLERWANSVILNAGASPGGNALAINFDSNTDSPPPPPQEIADSIESTAADISPSTDVAYNDYVNYDQGIGSVVIKCLNSKNKNKSNLIFTLKEAYPAALSPISMASDGSAYSTFSVTFQYRDYSISNGD